MKQLLINPKGRLFFDDATDPQLVDANAVLVDTVCSAVSTGTEKSIINRIRQAVRKSDADRPLGYANSGIVREVGEAVRDIERGDLVAVYGSQWALAGHAGMSAPGRLNFAKVPESVGPEEAAFAPIGTFPLNGLRLTKPQLGETVVIIGLGLLGLMAVQLAGAMGLVVVGVEPDPKRRGIALDVGADFAFAPDDNGLYNAVRAHTEGAGADAAIITAAGGGSAPVELAAELLREKGRISLVGGGSCGLERRGIVQQKELEILSVKAAGPGRYDEAYERECHDYPVGYVRWTANRNLKEVLRQMQTGGLDMKALITDRVPFDNAVEAFERLMRGTTDIIAMVFDHNRS